MVAKLPSIVSYTPPCRLLVGVDVGGYDVPAFIILMEVFVLAYWEPPFASTERDY
jgi:hypothetical protein